MLSNTGINKIILLGQVTEPPEVKVTAANQRFLCFVLLTNETIKKGQDNVEHKEYHNIKIPEKLIEQDTLQLEAGQTLYIEGKIHTSSFTDARQVKRYHLEILAGKVEVLNPVRSFVSY